MLALVIILALLLLFLSIPIGIDLQYANSLLLKLKIGPLRTALPPKKKTQHAEIAKPVKSEDGEKNRRNKKTELTARDIPPLVRIALKALGRFRRSLSIDLFRLHILVSADDPYDAVIRFGALNAGLGVLSPLAHNALKIRSEDIRTDVDVQGQEGAVELQIIATLQIWEILRIALCTGFAFLSWRSARKKAAKAAENTNDNSQEETAS